MTAKTVKTARSAAGSLLLVALLGLLALGVSLQAGCVLMLDSSADQCQTNADCARFRGTCNQKTKLCMASPMGAITNPGLATDGRPATDAGDGGSASDGTSSSLWPCANRNKPLVRISGQLTGNLQLICDNDYLLTGQVVVRPGVVLTIDAGTTLYGEISSKATLVVQPGARLVANGLRMAPIVFTSQADPGVRRPGDWGGVILLGRATTNAGKPMLEGLGDPAPFSGAEDNDDSGVLRFVRIEYAGGVSSGASVAGLTLAGVGRGTAINFVQVRAVSHDCFGFVGGTVNAKHLVCQRAGGDGFDWSGGYRGKLQFLVYQQDPIAAGETDGIEGENDPMGSNNPPLTEPTVYNVSLCGRATDGPGEQYGLLLRRGARAHLYNALVVGFEAGFDLRDPLTRLNVKSSLFPNPVAYPENGSNMTTHQDDDGGLDEVAMFNETLRLNAMGRPNIGDCFNPNTLGFAPSPALKANASQPPSDGFFDSQAAYVGAVRDYEDTWMTGSWLVWSDN